MVKTRNQLRKSNYKRTAKLGRDVYLPDKGGYTVIRNTPGTGNPKHPLYIIGDKKKQLKKKLSKKQKCSNYDCKRWFEVSAQRVKMIKVIILYRYAEGVTTLNVTDHSGSPLILRWYVFKKYILGIHQNRLVMTIFWYDFII
jgi:hypothetical protein